MANEDTPAPRAKAVSRRHNDTSLAIVVLTTTLGATLWMTSIAHATPVISVATSLADSSDQQPLPDERLMLGVLIFGFSLLAAGIWHRSFQAAMKTGKPPRP